MSEAGSRAPENQFGVWEAAFGLVVGFLLSVLAGSAYGSISGAHPGTTQTSIGIDIAQFVGLWTGFVGAAILASRTGGLAIGAGYSARAQAPGAHTADGEAPGAHPAGGGRPGAHTADGDAPGAHTAGGGRSGASAWDGFRSDFGVSIRLWPDVPLGIAVGVAAQYVLVPLLELPLQPFVSHLSSKLGQPATNLLSPVNGVSLVALTVLVCVGSPVAEELFFRGLLLRGLLGRFRHLGARAGPALSIVVTGLVFGLAHFEKLQFLGLAGFGVVLAYLAYRTGRLGPSILAHIAFNTTTIIAFVLQH